LRWRGKKHTSCELRGAETAGAFDFSATSIETCGSSAGGGDTVLNSLIALLILVADIWAIVQVFQSRESNGTKVLWTVLILVLPILGLIIWYFAGPRGQGG
jgi:hypothetical protein